MIYLYLAPDSNRFIYELVIGMLKARRWARLPPGVRFVYKETSWRTNVAERDEHGELKEWDGYSDKSLQQCITVTMEQFLEQALDDLFGNLISADNARREAYRDGLERLGGAKSEVEGVVQVGDGLGGSLIPPPPPPPAPANLNWYLGGVDMPGPMKAKGRPRAKRKP